MKNTYSLFIIFLIFNFSVNSAFAQGCVAIRGIPCNGSIGNSATLMKGEFLAGINYRYFRSFRHFRGNHEETNRVEEGTQVINNSNFLDLAVNYGISSRMYGNLTLPFVHHDRSSMYEHGGNPPNGLGQRHVTSSGGLADIRLGVGYWLFDPQTHLKSNYALGLGLKLPTGSFDYEATFYNQGPDKDQNIESVVDQSIQPGDGGLGVAVDMQGYQTITANLLLSANLYYMFNPRETNGVLTRNGREEFSCPDQFAARLGLNYITGIHGLAAYVGARVEGVPSSDLIGSSAGYRRPGYVLSTEPGISYSVNAMSLALNIPLAIYRNRTQSYSDKQSTKETGIFKQGDAAFANYLINFNISYRFGVKHDMEVPQHFSL